MITRGFDRAVAVVVLLATSPLMALAAIGIKLSSPGPVLYRAQRAGLGGVPFSMFKLRTMRQGASGSGRISGSADPRIFLVGRVLRRLKVDELPQLINVLRGDMALVGPRPEDVGIVRDHYDDMMMESLTVEPGVTSPGSLHYFAGEANLPRDPAAAEAVYVAELLPQKIALDLVYVRNRSICYEIQILSRTLFGIFGLDKTFAKTLDWETETAEQILAEAGHR